MIDTTRSNLQARRGDVVLVLYPNSDLRTAKKRPALVVQADDLDTGLPQVIVAMISSRLFRANHPSRILISITEQAGRESGLLSDSVVMTDNLAIVFVQALERIIGTLPMDEVDTALKHTLSL